MRDLRTRLAVRSKLSAGFSMLELAVVLSIISVLVIVVVPNVIQVARNKMAERSVKEVERLEEVARFAYMDAATLPPAAPGAPDPQLARWPGQPALPTGSTTCPIGPVAVQNDLIGRGLLTAQAFVNPWGNAYQMSVVGTGGLAGACSMQIRTQVPTEVANIVQSFLEQGECGGGCGAAGAGLTACCSTIPAPSMGETLGIWQPQVTEAVCESMGGIYNFPPPTCEINPSGGGMTSCRNEPSGICNQGERMMGANCTGKSCAGTMEVRCCQTTNQNSGGGTCSCSCPYPIGSCASPQPTAIVTNNCGGLGHTCGGNCVAGIFGICFPNGATCTCN